MQNTPLHLSHYFSKQQSTGKQTRNPTTDKKIEQSTLEFKRTHLHLTKSGQREPIGYQRVFQRGQRVDRASLEGQIKRLSVQKQKYMQKRRYQQAKKIEQKINWAKKALLQSKITHLVHSQRQERRAVSEAHKTQMQYFKYVWGQYFIKLQKRERQIFESFRRQQQQKYLLAQRRSRQRCRSHSLSREILQLHKTEQMLQKTKDYARLIKIKQQLDQAVAKDRRRRSAIVDRVTCIEKEKVKIEQCKKYNVLVQRLGEYRRDKESVYFRQQRRLRQKYKNVLQKLQHAHKYEFIAGQSQPSQL